jgi:hypothetical protein
MILGRFISLSSSQSSNQRVHLSILHSRAKISSLPIPYDPPKPHQFFPGVLMLSQASVIIGIRSCSEASLPAAGLREHFVRRARPLSLRCCVHRSFPFPAWPAIPFRPIICLGSLSPNSVQSSKTTKRSKKRCKQLATLSSVPAPPATLTLHSTDASRHSIRRLSLQRPGITSP